MNIGVLYFDGFWEQEIGLALNGFKDENIIAVALEDRVYVTEGKQKVLPDTTINKIDPDEFDLFIIPGGDPTHLFENPELKNFLIRLNEKNKYIAGICGGTFLMAKWGILDNKKCTGAGSGIDPNQSYSKLFNKSIVLDEDVVVDGNTITATGQAFIEFAVELYRIMDVFDSEEELIKEYKWLKNIK